MPSTSGTSGMKCMKCGVRICDFGVFLRRGLRFMRCSSAHVFFFNGEVLGLTRS